MEKYEKKRACILVKAYPQHSQKYQETVCVAAVTEDHQLLRIYPIRFRHLTGERRFNRFDMIEAEMTRATEDPRPESYRIKEDTLRVVLRSENTSPADKVRLWKPCIVESLGKLEQEQQDAKRSLGIIKPDEGTLEFTYEAIDRATDEARETANSVYVQQSLLEPELKKLPAPEFIFRYRFDCGGRPHHMQLHDWETETTFHRYKHRYSTKEVALEKMVEYYQERVPNMNPHLIMGNMHKRPYQFIVIGVLRTTADVDRADAQGDLLF